MARCLPKIQNIILNSNCHIWLPEIDTKNSEYTSQELETNSWFDFTHYRSIYDGYPLPKTGIGPYSSNCGKCNNCKHNIKHRKQLKCNPILDPIIKCLKVDIILDSKQKIIIDNWIHACTIMYNIAINRINKSHTKYTSLLETKNVILAELSKKSKTKTKLRKDITQIKKDIIHIKKDIKRIKKKLQNLGNFYSTRKKLKKFRNKLRSQSYPHIKKFNINESNAVPAHIIDQSIRSACSNYKSATSNKFNGHIKKFHLRHLKYNRKNRVMYIEKGYFNDITMCPRSLGDIIGIYNEEPFDFKIINGPGGSDCTFKYNAQSNKYTLYVPIKTEQKNENHKYEFISLDPGLRTFMTGISESTVIEMGTNVTDKIYDYIRKIDKIDKLIPKKSQKKEKLREKLLAAKIDKLNPKKKKLKEKLQATKIDKLIPKISQKKKKLLAAKINKLIPKRKRKKYLTLGQLKKKVRKRLRAAKTKINNQIDDMHWKIIKYLTTKHRNVMIGNLSTKNILSNKQKQIFGKAYKRVIPLIKLYKFKQKLKYKCKERRVNYKEIDEYYTSKLCSVCASYKIVKGKIYKCDECGIEIDRDINAARNIYMKRLM